MIHNLVPRIAWQAVVQARLGNLQRGGPGDRAHFAELAEIEVEAMRESYARALELRNAAVSSACRLPPETMANVFSYLQAMWPMELKRDKNTTLNEDSEDSERVFYFTMAWYKVAHVCRLWRQVNSSVLDGLCACTEN